MKLIVEEKSKIEIAIFDIDEFGHSNKALWLYRKYAPSLAGMQDRKTNYFIPTNYIAKQGSTIYIPTFAINKFIKSKADSINELERTFPVANYTTIVTYDKWVAFQKQYSYNKS